MRVVIALGGNALLERGEAPNSDIQETHVVSAVTALAPLARSHQLFITHGNGPQVGVLALESARDPALSHPYPFDVLGAETQGMIGYWLVQVLHNTVPGQPAGCLICRTVVHADDPAFAHPTKFVGPVYDEVQARQLATQRGWNVRQDGTAWRRVVPSPEPVALVELDMIKLLARQRCDCRVRAGGGGVPVVRDDAGALHGVEAVVDKDLTAALLARDLAADALVILTDVDAVEDGYGTPQARPIHRATPQELRARPFPAGSMGPKVDAACRFVEATGKMAAIGRLDDAEALLAWEGRHDRGPDGYGASVNDHPDGRVTLPQPGRAVPAAGTTTKKTSHRAFPGHISLRWKLRPIDIGIAVVIVDGGRLVLPDRRRSDHSQRPPVRPAGGWAVT